MARLASFSRLILFDKRGTGLSDRVPLDQLPTLEERMDDVVAVLDAVGSERTALFSHSEGGNLAVLFAATFPQRTIALVTAGIFAKRIWSPDYPWAPTPEHRAAEIEDLERNWPLRDLAHLPPSAVHDEAFGRRLATYSRQSASSGVGAALLLAAGRVATLRGAGLLRNRAVPDEPRRPRSPAPRNGGPYLTVCEPTGGTGVSPLDSSDSIVA